MLEIRIEKYFCVKLVEPVGEVYKCIEALVDPLPENHRWSCFVKGHHATCDNHVKGNLRKVCHGVNLLHVVKDWSEKKRIKTEVILLLDHLEFWNIVIIGIGIHDRIYQGLFIFHYASEADIITKLKVL